MQKIVPQIPKNDAMFRNTSMANEFPNWGFFSEEKLRKSKGKLLMMDIDFGNNCSLHCPTCFRRESVLDEGPMRDLTPEELTKFIINAKKFGLETVKICGAGEPFENKGFFEFLREMNKNNIGVGIFTKGHVIGNDEETRKHFEYLGFKNALDFCKALYELKTSVMLSFQSFYPERQDKLVGGTTGYTEIRNMALSNLVEAGFNSATPTRLALCSNPIVKENAEEIYDIYVFARERNIYPVTAALMTSGMQFTDKFLKFVDISTEEKIKLWFDIYSYNIEHGLQTLSQVEKEGISALPGIHPCNQIAYDEKAPRGIYLTLNGNVTACPGYSTPLGNIRLEPLELILKRVAKFLEDMTHGRCDNKFNCHCPPKYKTLPERMFEEVIKRLREKFGAS
ncbi:MAG: radical SAM protein [Candidatus Micrarchaeota archaeon]